MATTLDTTKAAPSRWESAGSWLGRAGTSRVTIFGFVVLAALVPLFVSGYLLFQLELVLLYISAAVGLNLAVGYAGEYLLCQAPVMGVGAYAAGIVALRYGWSVWATIPISIVGAIAWQVIIGLAGLRVRGLYLGLLSFFSVLVFGDLVTLAQPFTGGDNGLIGLPTLVSPYSSAADSGPYEICVGVLVVSMLLVGNLVRSGWGIRLRYLRDAPLALGTVGLSIATTKMTSYIVAAIPAGLAGWCLAYINQSVTSSLFGISLTLILFAGVQLIGPGTLLGPIVGAGLLEGYSQFVGPFSEYNVLGLGLLLAAAVIAVPGGLRRAVVAQLARMRPAVPVSLAAPESTRQAEPMQLAAPPVAPRWSGGEVLLRVIDVTKSFGGNKAVRSASFEVHEGQVVALMGENGSGKTTLVNLISGFLRPDGGTIELCGTTVAGLTPSAVARLRCARTFQAPQVVGEMTVRENIEAGMLRRGAANPAASILLPWYARRLDRARRAEAEAVCVSLGLGPARDVSVDSLPLGLRRMVEVGRAIAANARILILDEPSAGLNPEELSDLSVLLKRLADSGMAVLLVEHNVDLVLRTCTDVVLMSMGEIAGTFTDLSPDDLPEPLRRHLQALPASSS